jgi:hypothetical protein
MAQKERMFLKRVVSACDFFLWGYLKSNVYVRKPRTVDDLKFSIREEIANCATRNVSKCDAEL